MAKPVSLTATERKVLTKIVEVSGVNTKIISRTDKKGVVYDRFLDDYDGSTAPFCEGIKWIIEAVKKTSLSSMGLTEKETKTAEKLFSIYG